MKRSYGITILCTLAVMLQTANLLNAQTHSPQQQALEASIRVADKLLRDTRFQLVNVPQKEELGMQVIDFRDIIHARDQSAYAVRMVNAANDSVVNFGISHGGAATVWVNGKQVYNASNNAFVMPREHAYNRFLFQRYFNAGVKKGANEIRIKYTSSGAQPVILFRAQAQNGDADNTVKTETARPWMLLGSFPAKDTFRLRNIAAYHQSGGRYYTWQTLPQRMIPDLLTDTSLTYFRDPYLDWNYSNGNTVWSTLLLTATGAGAKYQAYVERYTGFMMQHLDYFRKQYDSLFVLRGSFHRFYRMSMLDDAGSAVLPYIDLYLLNKDARIRTQVLEPVADYILHKQVRLPDGTYCRPEPVAYTVWCDDLFMSVPFLLRWAKITGNSAYYDEAVQQFRGFRKYLLDPQTNLFQHGWFSNTQQRSPVRWGRANGWIAWATTELLERLPATHPAYNEIRDAFRLQMTTLKQYQAASGMWHQVLDKPASFEETSCTAMFTMAMAKGVRMGWLDAGFRDAALRGWQAVQGKIEADGTVHDICRGTEIGFDDNFYFTRQRFDQDPRGLGAVIAAGVEVSRMP